MLIAEKQTLTLALSLAKRGGIEISSVYNFSPG
jgi:hypothetical protein